MDWTSPKPNYSLVSHRCSPEDVCLKNKSFIFSQTENTSTWCQASPAPIANPRSISPSGSAMTSWSRRCQRCPPPPSRKHCSSKRWKGNSSPFTTDYLSPSATNEKNRTLACLELLFYTRFDSVYVCAVWYV